MSKKIIRKPYLSIVTFLMLLLVTTSTHAGFQWVPASEKKSEMKQESVAMPDSALIQKIEKKDLALEPSPILYDQDMDLPFSNMVPMTSMAANKPKMNMIQVKDNMDTSTVEEVKNINKPAMSVATMPDMAMSLNAEEVIGFGTDMPLALALRQVVPVEYAFSFGAQVNPGYRVSWNGGKSWDQVVAEMIAPLDLISIIKGNIVHIKKISATYNIDSPHGQKTVHTIYTDHGNASPVVLNRKNIADPGQTAQQQHPETMNHIQKLTDTHKIHLAEPADNGSKERQFWEAQKGDSLKNTLARWSAQSGTMLIWESTRDYTINNRVFVNDTYTNAIKTLFMDMSSEEGPTLHLINKTSENDKNKLVVGDIG